MPITIGSNIVSLKAQGQLGRATDALSTTYERLSSGQRINKASDDAAGLAIASNLNTRSKVYRQASRNVNDGISYLNVAEGALGQLTDIVTRQTELAEQAANGSYSGKQRVALDREAFSLTQEYNRILESTEFNGIKILTNSGNQLSIQQGYGAQQSTQLSVGSALGPSAGSGTFGGSITGYTYLGGFSGPELADFTNDGILDLIVNSGDGVLHTAVGDGAGGFTASQAFVSPSTTTNTADYNQDGKADIAAFDVITGNLKVYTGTGNGTFNAAVSYPGQVPGPSGTLRSFSADFNGDGALDVIGLVPNQSVLALMMNDGQGRFTQSSVALPMAVIDFNVGDLNSDGVQDIIVAQDATSSRVLLGTGTGTFTPGASFESGSRSLQLADFNNDGKLDVLGHIVYAGDYTTLNYGNGNGTFGSAITVSAAAGGRPAVGHFNGDQYLDFVTNDNATSTIYTSNGNATFSVASTFSMATIWDFTVNDVNRDGVADIFHTEGIPGATKLRLGIADPTGRVNPFQVALNLTTQAGARTALGTLKTNLERLSKEVGNLGAFQSRLQVSSNLLAVTRENYLAAESIIKDADIAGDSANLVRQQILQQAASSVLAQANQNPNLALILLRS